MSEIMSTKKKPPAPLLKYNINKSQRASAHSPRNSTILLKKGTSTKRKISARLSVSSARLCDTFKL